LGELELAKSSALEAATSAKTAYDAAKKANDAKTGATPPVALTDAEKKTEAEALAASDAAEKKSADAIAAYRKFLDEQNVLVKARIVSELETDI